MTELDQLRRERDVLAMRVDTLLNVIGVIRLYPDFDSGGPLVDMMVEALAGKRPALLDARDALAEGRMPPATPPHSPQPDGSITPVEAGAKYQSQVGNFGDSADAELARHAARLPLPVYSAAQEPQGEDAGNPADFKMLQAVYARLTERCAKQDEYARHGMLKAINTVERMMLEYRPSPCREGDRSGAVPDGWKQALHAAVSALYFDDGSKFRAALGTVIRHLDPAIAGDVLCNPKMAFDKTSAMIAAATTVREGGSNPKEGGK
jgi:hypothetical protein